MIGRVLVATIFVLAVGAAGCGLTDVGRPLSIQLTADPAAGSVGDTIRFNVSGTGSFMSGFTIDYNDGSDPGQFATGGSQSASTNFSHVYSTADMYRVVATIIDSSGELADTVDIVIEAE